MAELIHGVLHQSPRPTTLHARAGTTVGEELGPPFNRGKGEFRFLVLGRISN